MWTFLNVVSTLAWELVSAASPHDSSCFDQDLFYSMSLSLSTALRIEHLRIVTVILKKTCFSLLLNVKHLPFRHFQWTSVGSKWVQSETGAGFLLT